MKKTYWISLIIFSAILVMAMLMVGCVGCFFDIPSLIMVALSTFIMLLANYSFSDIGKYFAIGFKKDDCLVSDIENGIVFFKSLQKYLLLAGAIGVFMGLISMLATLDDPNHVGKSLALALITFLYSCFFSMVVAVPFRTGLEKLLVDKETENK